MDPQVRLERTALGAESIGDLAYGAKLFDQKVRDTIPEVVGKYALLRDKEFLVTFPDIAHLTSSFYCKGFQGNHSLVQTFCQGAFLTNSLEEWLHRLSIKDEEAIRRYKAYRDAYVPED